jgi:hypothetical protein
VNPQPVDAILVDRPSPWGGVSVGFAVASLPLAALAYWTMTSYFLNEVVPLFEIYAQLKLKMVGSVISGVGLIPVLTWALPAISAASVVKEFLPIPSRPRALASIAIAGVLLLVAVWYWLAVLFAKAEVVKGII